MGERMKLTAKNFLDGTYTGVLLWWSPAKQKVNCNDKNHYWRGRSLTCECKKHDRLK